MKTKTNQLSGRQLDYAVAKALGADILQKGRITNFGEDMELFDWFTAPVNWWADSFLPSSDWAKGGPLIEKYGIRFLSHGDEFVAIPKIGDGNACGAPDHLTAAMRSIVAAELGDEVEVQS